MKYLFYFRFLYVSANEIDNISQVKLEDRFNNVPAIKGIHSHHHFVPLSLCCLQAFPISISDEHATVFHVLNEPYSRKVEYTSSLAAEDLKPGDWVLVDYFGLQYPGSIAEIRTDSVVVSCLEKTGNLFKYPAKQDEHLYPYNDILAMLHEPELKNPRGFYSYTIKSRFLKK